MTQVTSISKFFNECLTKLQSDFSWMTNMEHFKNNMIINSFDQKDFFKLKRTASSPEPLFFKFHQN